MLKRNHTTRKPARGIFRSFLVGFTALTALVAVGSAAFLQRPSVESVAAEASWTPNPLEKEVDRSELAVTAVSSTLTGSAQSISVTFRSKKIEAFPNTAKYKNVFALPDDETWTKEAALAQYEEDKAAAEAEGKAVELRHYPSSVYNIEYNPTAVKIDGRNDRMIIPSFVTRDKGFVLDVTGILADCCFKRKTDLVSYDNISEIIIPATIKTIAPGAFYGVPENVKIRCEAPEYTDDGQGGQKKTYPEEWTDATPEYGYTLTAAEKKALAVQTPSPVTFGKGADFFLGIQGNGYDYPMWMEYQLETSQDGSEWTIQPEKHWAKTPILSANNPYDAVGSSMGLDVLTQNISLNVPSGARINAQSVCFHNIFRARAAEPGESETMSMVPDWKEGEWDGEYFTKPSIAYSIVPHFEEFYSIAPISYSTLGDFLQLEVEFTRQKGDTGYGIYPILQPQLFAQNKANLDSGKLQVRYQLSSLDQAYYRFTTADNQVYDLRVATPVKYVLMPEAKAYRTGFLINIHDIKGPAVGDIRKVEFVNFGIKTDLYNNSTHAIVTKSSVALRFASLTLFDDLPAARHINVGLVIGLTYAAYVVLFALGSVAYFFYAKKRFRNDEFRRVNDKKYWLGALKNFVGFAFIVSAVLFIFCRWGLMRTTVVVFNPLDAFVALFTVIGAIFLGFAIRNLVVSIQAANKRKQAARLKLDEDVDDDGTH